MKLFCEDSCSPFFRKSHKVWDITEEEFEAVVTPYGKTVTADNPLFIDEDSGIGMEYDMVGKFRSSPKEDLNGSYNEPKFQIQRRRKTNRQSNLLDAKKSLFSTKRQPEDDLDDVFSPSVKKLRDNECPVEDFSVQSPAAGTQSIIQAVDQLSTKEELVADGSRDYSLPTVPGKHNDLKSISPDTMADVIQGRFSDIVHKVTTIDCRYPYEFEGGHIKDAVNLYTKESVHKLLTEEVKPGQTHILIFHCEFSSERGPKMYRFLRSEDRDLNKDSYPKLNYPEIYLLEGGYKAFYHSHPELCDPTGYKPMLHEDHLEDLRHFRTKSKSWNGDKKGKKPRAARRRSCLTF